jgi:hypothetical protein
MLHHKLISNCRRPRIFRVPLLSRLLQVSHSSEWISVASQVLTLQIVWSQGVHMSEYLSSLEWAQGQRVDLHSAVLWEGPWAYSPDGLDSRVLPSPLKHTGPEAYILVTDKEPGSSAGMQMIRNILSFPPVSVHVADRWKKWRCSFSYNTGVVWVDNEGFTISRDVCWHVPRHLFIERCV